jgi:hypothetical protein
MRTVANVRLFMLRPESFLLHAGQVLEGASVSDESVQDAQRVSVRTNLDAARNRELIYQSKVTAAILQFGYNVIDLASDFHYVFDLAVEDDKGRQIYVELKNTAPRKLSAASVERLEIMSRHSAIPVILVSSSSLSSAAEEVLHEVKDLEVVIWRDEKDDPQLGEALQRLFNRLPGITLQTDQSLE